MLISHEVPIALLNESKSFNDYDYALVHLFEQYPGYYEFYKQSIKEKRTVLLDNSIFELGTAFDADLYASWIKKLLPTEYIIPDVLDNCQETIQNLDTWLHSYDVPGLKIGVIQGSTEEEAMHCFNNIKDKVDKVAISFNSRFFEKDDSSLLEQWMHGRQQFFDKINDNKTSFHLLGCSLPQEFKHYVHHKNVVSIDTSNPVVHAINNIRYNNGLNDKISTKLIEYINETSFNYELIHYNIKEFRKLCEA